MQATETLCHLSVTDIKKRFCNVWFFCKNKACVNCGKESATTLTWLLQGGSKQKMLLKKWILPHCVYLALTSANKMFFPLPLPVRIAMAFYNFFLLSRNTSNRFLLDNACIRFLRFLMRLICTRFPPCWSVLDFWEIKFEKSS